MDKTSAFTLQVENLSKSFRVGFARRRRVLALRQISFNVSTGTTFGFLGPNGAGKTTTIKTMVGLIFPSGGEVRVFGADPSNATSRRRIGYLPESPSFQDHLTGREVLGFSCELAHLPRSEHSGRIDTVLHHVKLAHAADLQVRRYSKGMVQRLGIAQALVHDPELVILDEPMSGLDPIGRRDIKDLILSLRARGKTVFFSTHIIADVEEICDEVAILVGGRVVRSGKVPALLGSERREFEVIATDVPQNLPQLRGRSAEGTVMFELGSHDEARQLVEELWRRNARVVSLRTRRYGLENIFLEEVAKQPVAQRLEE